MSTWRLVPQFDSKLLGQPQNPSRYRVETTEPMTLQEAMNLLRELGSPYSGQYLDNRPR